MPKSNFSPFISLSKTNRFLLFALIAHGYILLFIGGYSYFISAFSSSTTTTTANTKEPNPFLFSSLMGDKVGMDSMSSSSDPQWIVNYFSIITIILLYISLSLKFTWPVRIEETLIIILLWMLISN